MGCQWRAGNCAAGKADITRSVRNICEPYAASGWMQTGYGRCHLRRCSGQRCCRCQQWWYFFKIAWTCWRGSKHCLQSVRELGGITPYATRYCVVGCHVWNWMLGAKCNKHDARGCLQYFWSVRYVYIRCNSFLLTKCVISLGTGEQIMQTTITSKLVQNICTCEDIYEAVTETLQKQFLGTYSSSLHIVTLSLTHTM